MSRNQQKVDAAVQRLRDLGAEAFGGAADVRDPDATSAVLHGAHAAFGDIDVLISGAAGNFTATALDISPNPFKSVIDIDLRGTFHLLRTAYPLLRRPGAVIINVSAPQAFLPMVEQAHVCAAKAGVDMLTRVLALQWGSAGIRVNSVVPGAIEGTEGMDRVAPNPETRDIVSRTIPAGRWGTPRGLAQACLMLASPLADYITGVVRALTPDCGHA